MSFAQVSPASVQVSEFRRKSSGSLEIRALEVDGASGSGSVHFDIPIRHALQTDVLGTSAKSASLTKRTLHFTLGPWKFETFSLN